MNAFWVVLQLIFILGTTYFIFSLFCNITRKIDNLMVITSWKTNTGMAIVCVIATVFSGLMVT